MSRIEEIVTALRKCNAKKGHRCSECPVFSKYENRICKAKVDELAASIIELLQAELDRITAERDEWKRKCEAAVDFSVRAEQDYMECDKMFIHVSALKQETGYNAYLVDAKRSGAKPLSFAEWMRGAEQEEA